MSTNWYALRSKPRKEASVSRQARARGFEAFYPCIRVQPVDPRSSRIRPFFPNYLFVRADLEVSGLSTFQYMPHAIGLVCFGGEPAPVSELIVEAIRKKIARISAAGGELFESLSPGDRVWIEAGPLSGYEAVFDARLRGSERVRVLLKMLSDQYVPVELSAGVIEKASSSSSQSAYRHAH